MAKKKNGNERRSRHKGQIELPDWDRDTASEWLRDIDGSEIDSRQRSMTFYQNKGYDLMGFDSIYDCLKASLKKTAPSTIYRQINCGKVEHSLGLRIGSQVLTSMLEIFKYDEEHWEDIHDYTNEKRPSVAQVKAALNLLEKEGKLVVIKPKQQPPETIVASIVDKATNLDEHHLHSLSEQIETLIESFD